MATDGTVRKVVMWLHALIGLAAAGIVAILLWNVATTSVYICGFPGLGADTGAPPGRLGLTISCYGLVSVLMAGLTSAAAFVTVVAIRRAFPRGRQVMFGADILGAVTGFLFTTGTNVSFGLLPVVVLVASLGAASLAFHPAIRRLGSAEEDARDHEDQPRDSNREARIRLAALGIAGTVAVLASIALGVALWVVLGTSAPYGESFAMLPTASLVAAIGTGYATLAGHTGARDLAVVTSVLGTLSGFELFVGLASFGVFLGASLLLASLALLPLAFHPALAFGSNGEGGRRPDQRSKPRPRGRGEGSRAKSRDPIVYLVGIVTVASLALLSIVGVLLGDGTLRRHHLLFAFSPLVSTVLGIETVRRLTTASSKQRNLCLLTAVVGSATGLIAIFSVGLAGRVVEISTRLAGVVLLSAGVVALLTIARPSLELGPSGQ